MFEYLPIESQIHKYQEDYYKVIAKCNNKGDSTEFVSFMLKMIDEVLDEALNTPNVSINEEVININKLLSVLEKNVPEEFVKNKVGFSGLGIEFSKIRELIKTPAVNGNYDGLVADLEPQYRKEKLNSKIRGFQSKNKEIEDDDNIR